MLSLTSVYGIKTDNTHSGLFLQVLQLALPVAAYSAVDLPRRKERTVRLGTGILQVMRGVIGQRMESWHFAVVSHAGPSLSES